MKVTKAERSVEDSNIKIKISPAANSVGLIAIPLCYNDALEILQTDDNTHPHL
jgi:hypothetical protein